MRSVFRGFKDFIMRGNVMDLAVAVVIGTAFTALVNALVAGLFTPLIAAIFGKNDLTQVGIFTLNGAEFHPGVAIDALVKFLVIATVVYFVIVLPLNIFAERRKKGIEPEPTKPGEDILLLQEIRDLLASQSPRAAQDELTGRRPSTGAHALITALDTRPRSD